MKTIVVIGAGIAGLLATQHAIDATLKVICYEQTEHIGGTWVLEEHVGKHDNNIPIHSAMYKDLVTNQPLELMGFPHFEHQIDQVCFILLLFLNTLHYIMF